MNKSNFTDSNCRCDDVDEHRIWGVRGVLATVRCTILVVLASSYLGLLACDGGDKSNQQANSTGSTNNADHNSSAANNMTNNGQVDPNNQANNANNASNGVNNSPEIDRAPPTLYFETPFAGSTVSGQVDVVVIATDDRGVTEVSFAVDTQEESRLVAAPWVWRWDTTDLSAGPYTLSATAQDAAGNETTASLEVNLAGTCNAQGDCPPQSVRIITPVEGARVCGMLNVEATATDDTAISRIEFRVDGVPLGVAEQSPHQALWDTTRLGNGEHVLRATAFDTANQQAFDTARVWVDNQQRACDNLPNVNITTPTDGSYVNGTLEVEASASDDVGVLGVAFFINNGRVAQDDSIPYKIEWDTDDFEEGAHTLKAIAQDTSEQTTTHQIQVTIDRTPPVAYLLSPQEDDFFAEHMNAEAFATDNFAIRSVEFAIDGDIVTALNSPPWQATLDLSGVRSGTHRLSMIATDGVGLTESDSVSFDVDRPPSVRIVSPTSNNTVSGPVLVTLESRDDLDPSGTLKLYVDNQIEAQIQRSNTFMSEYFWTPPYRAGSHTLRAEIEDRRGQRIFDEISVRIDHPAMLSVSVCPDGFSCLQVPCSTLTECPEAYPIYAPTVDFRIDIEDDAPTRAVTLLIDDVIIASTSTFPYRLAWNTSQHSIGIHTVDIRADDDQESTISLRFVVELVGTESRIADLSVGPFHRCLLREDGSVSCARHVTDDQSEQSVPPSDIFIQISAGTYSSCGITIDGSIRCWGDSRLLDPPAGIFHTVSVGGGHACAIDQEGTIQCWGLNYLFEGIPEGRFRQISAGNFGTCAVRDTGAIECWGADSLTPPDGEFISVETEDGYACGLRADQTVECWGDGSTTVQVPSGTFTKISTGEYHACGLRTDGSITCWGNDGPRLVTSSPTGVFTSVGSGFSESCALRSDNALVCWGLSTLQLSKFSGPCGIERHGGSLVCWDHASTLNTPSGQFTDISYLCALSTEGTALCWGRHEPLPDDRFLQISSTYSHGCGVRQDNTISCWGDNSYGESPPPEYLFTQVTTCEWSDGGFSCGLTQDGSVRCWGPDLVRELDFPQGNFVQIDCTSSSDFGAFICGLRNDGSAECWGASWEEIYLPTLSDGPYTQISAAFDDGGDSLILLCGLKADGRVKCDHRDTSEHEVLNDYTLSYIEDGCGLQEPNGRLVCW